MEKNTIVPIYVEVWNSTTNTRHNLDDSANLSMQCSKDGAQCTAGAGAFAEVLSSAGAHVGLFKYTPTQTETNGDALYFLPSTTTANLVAVIAGMYTQTMRGTDAALLATNYTAPPAMITAQAVRDAMKLDASAGAPAAGSIDKQLDDVPADTAGAVLDEALGAHAGFLTTVNTIAPATPGDVAAVDADVIAVGNLVSGLNDVSVGDLIAAAHDEPIEGAYTSREIHRLLAAVAAGRTTVTPTGPGTADVVFKDIDTAATDRITANMTGSVRTAVAKDVS
jgi:hypothetical protein